MLQGVESWECSKLVFDYHYLTRELRIRSEFGSEFGIVWIRILTRVLRIRSEFWIVWIRILTRELRIRSEFGIVWLRIRSEFGLLAKLWTCQRKNISKQKMLKIFECVIFEKRNQRTVFLSLFGEFRPSRMPHFGSPPQLVLAWSGWN